MTTVSLGVGVWFLGGSHVSKHTEFELWLTALGANTIIFTGIDTYYICVESSVRDAFNRGYDVTLVSDCVASRNSKHHQTTLDQVGEAFGLVVSSDELIRLMETKDLELSPVPGRVWPGEARE